MSHPIARKPWEAKRILSLCLVSPAWVGSFPGSPCQPLMPLLFGRGSLPVSVPWGCRFGLKEGELGPNMGTWSQACGWRSPEHALLVTSLSWAAEGLGAPSSASEATLPRKEPGKPAPWNVSLFPEPGSG